MLILQIWGGGCYLLNKIFFSKRERSAPEERSMWQIRAWLIYLAGLPAWTYIMIREHNWMAAAVEAGGGLLILLGIYTTVRGLEKIPAWVDHAARLLVLFGISYSLYEFGGLKSLNQFLELGIVIGFLCGTYLLANEKSKGYLFFALMSISAGALMFVQNYYWLTLQQILSLFFVLDAALIQKQRSLEESTLIQSPVAH